MEAETTNQASGAHVGSLIGDIKQAMREKTWDEIDNAQRMEKMREELRYLRRMVTDLQSTVRKFKAHQHAQDGSIMVPLNNRDDDDRPRGYFYDPLK